MANYESNPQAQPSLFPQSFPQGSVATVSPRGSALARTGSQSTAADKSVEYSTTEQLPDITRNKHQGNPQSEAANAKVHPSKSELKTKILNFLRERVGSTTEEVATGLNLRYTTASGRISELRRDSALEDSGRTRPTSSGCAATVWTTKGTA